VKSGLLLLIFVGSALQTAGGQTTQPPANPAPLADQTHPATYICSVVVVDTADRDRYVSWLARVQRPVWQELKRRGQLADAYVYEVHKVRSALPNVPAWNFLLLMQMAQEALPKDFLEAERALVKAQSGPDAPAKFTVRRIEVLRSTPNSYYPEPTAANRLREAEASFDLEYIDVNHTTAALDEYREAMRRSLGPRTGELVRSGIYFNFMALETVSVEYAEPAMPSWNQMHFNGGLPNEVTVPRSPEIQAIFRRLGDIRVKPRTDTVFVVPELTVR
jgi:hypothetical protein